MAHLSYLVRDLARSFPNGQCIHQSLMGIPGVDNSATSQCGRSVLRNVAHGWLCEEHYQVYRRRPQSANPDDQQVETILITDLRAIGRGNIVNNSGVRILEQV